MLEDGHAFSTMQLFAAVALSVQNSEVIEKCQNNYPKFSDMIIIPQQDLDSSLLLQNLVEHLMQPFSEF